MSRTRDGSAVPDVVAPPRGHPRFPHFDALRAIAALAVLVVHTSQFAGALNGSTFAPLLSHLDIGVTLFFVISGFLLYRPFVAARVLGAPASRVRDYARRRFLRIAPGYWLALTALSIFPGIYGAFSSNWWVYYGLLQNYPIYTRSGGCARDALRCGINPAWSLAIEVGFYVVLPFFALVMSWLTGRLKSTGRWLRGELAVLALISAISVPIVLKLDTERARLLWFSPLGHGWWFAAGMALAALSVRRQQRTTEEGPSWLAGNRSLVPWALAVALYVLASVFYLDPVGGLGVPAGQYRVEYGLFGLIAVLLLLPAVFAHETGGAVRRLLGSRVLAWLGLISYGIFLWHWPVVYALYRGGVGAGSAWAFPLLTSLTLVITLVCAAASYYGVERPLMRMKYRGSAPGEPRRLRRAAA